MKLLIGLIVFVGILIGFGYHVFNELTRPLPLPALDTNKYWGKGEGKNYKPDKTIRKFQLQVKDEIILDLQEQLNRTYHFAKPLDGIKFQYGYNTDALTQLQEFWRDDYLPRWKEREELLNKFPQFTTEIQGLKIHFLHVKPTEKDRQGKTVLPLLLLHGWPGSVREFYDFIPMLTNTSESFNFVFEVVAPSLVGYGFSDPAAKKGFNAVEMAIVMRNLMLRLGYEKFVIQGGDWGSIIGSNLATIFPGNTIGYHSNMCVLQTPLAMLKGFVASFNPMKYIPSRFFIEHHFPLKDKYKMLLEESGYFHIQATKPDTVGHALTNSPIGLASYIAEKFQTSTGPGTNQNFAAIYNAYTVDAVLDNIMIYYLTNSATTAGRFYAENMSKEYRAMQIERVPSPVPAGCIRFRNDLPAAMDWQLRDKFPNLVHSKYVHHGGHFAALENPVLLYISFEEFVNNIPELMQKNKENNKEHKDEL